MKKEILKFSSFTYNQDGVLEMSKHDKMNDWPFVYLIHDKKNVYIGETQQLSIRTKQHLDNNDIGSIDFNKARVHAIYHNKFNKSAILDIEQSLITYMTTDGKYHVNNQNPGQYHDYFDRQTYHDRIFREIWDYLFAHNLATKELDEIRNLDIFKYSPYFSLNSEQFNVAKLIFRDISQSIVTEPEKKKIYLINGEAGTGKTILALSMIRHLLDAIIGFDYSVSMQEEDEEIDSKHPADETLNYYKALLSAAFKAHNIKKIGYVIPMQSLNRTITKVFSELHIKGVDILTQTKSAKEDYDIIFVDEAHRLTDTVKSGQTVQVFRDACAKRGLNPKESNPLEIIIRSARYVILFYDANQSVRKVDIPQDKFFQTINTYCSPTEYNLVSQMRVNAGGDYIQYIDDILNSKQVEKLSFDDYRLELFDDLDLMVKEIKSLDRKDGLCRLTAGYAFKWLERDKSFEEKKKNKLFDIVVGKTKLIWNTTDKGWITSPNAVNEVGCVHTTQGYDINVCGVIFGPEIDYDFEKKRITIDMSKVFDKGVNTPKLVLNAYKVLMKRGIRGTLVYCVNENLRKYLSKLIDKHN